MLHNYRISLQYSNMESVHLQETHTKKILHCATRCASKLPYYHRLALNLRRTFEFKGSLKLEMNAGVTNAYNRANVFYTDRITAKRVDQLPILPTIGLEISL